MLKLSAKIYRITERVSEARGDTYYDVRVLDEDLAEFHQLFVNGTHFRAGSVPPGFKDMRDYNIEAEVRVAPRNDGKPGLAVAQGTWIRLTNPQGEPVADQGDVTPNGRRGRQAQEAAVDVPF